MMKHIIMPKNTNEHKKTQKNTCEYKRIQKKTIEIIWEIHKYDR
jgi:hypothetical protein